MIITLCGSTRFEKYFHAWNEALSLAGHIVLSISAYPSQKKTGQKWYTDAQKRQFDNIHLQKIRASDAILLLNVDGYVGESARREVEFARKEGKQIFALESWGAGCSIAEQRGDPSMITSSSEFRNPYELAPCCLWPNDPRDELKKERERENISDDSLKPWGPVVREIMKDPSLQDRFPDGISGAEMFQELEKRGTNVAQCASVLDVISYMREWYGPGK